MSFLLSLPDTVDVGEADVEAMGPDQWWRLRETLLVDLRECNSTSKTVVEEDVLGSSFYWLFPKGGSSCLFDMGDLAERIRFDSNLYFYEEGPGGTIDVTEWYRQEPGTIWNRFGKFALTSYQSH